VAVTIAARDPVRPAAPPRASAVPIRSIAAGAAGIGVALAVWVVGGRAGWANGMVVTPAEALAPLFGDSAQIYRRATTATVTAAARGFVVGGLLAFVSALVAATVPALRAAISRFATIANAAPWVAVAPCMLVILGRERGPSAVAALAVFFFVFVATSVGLGATPAASHHVLTALGAPRRRTLRLVQLPASWPSVVDGCKLAAPAAMAGAIFGEWYGAQRGLGVLLIGAMQSGRAERLWAASLIAASCGLLAYGALALLQKALVARYGGSVTGGPVSAGQGERPRPATIAFETLSAVVVVGLLIAAWWTWIEVADVSPLVVPRPMRVLEALVDTPGDYLSAAIATIGTAAVALALGFVVGFTAAVVTSRSVFLGGMIVPVVVVLAATPLVALLPLFARIFGYEPTTVRLLAAVMVFFPVFVFTRSGLRATTGATTDALHALGASTRIRFRLLDLPGAVPHIASGARLAAGSAIVAAVVGETLIGNEGLGVLFAQAYRLLQLPRAFGAAIVIVVISVLVFAAAGVVERAVHRRWS
jgi:ABC-type nitrate/sulfonate/bicarbonate transport system permease component